MDRQRRNKLVKIVQEQLEPKGFECVDVDWIASQRILRVFIEKCGVESTGVMEADANVLIDMNDCVIATRALNESDVVEREIEGAFTLEVSSPGLERPLRTIEHFAKFVGSQVEVKLSEAQGDRKHGVGEVLSVDEGSIINLETSRGKWSFPLDLVIKANLVYDWNKA